MTGVSHAIRVEPGLANENDIHHSKPRIIDVALSRYQRILACTSSIVGLMVAFPVTVESRPLDHRTAVQSLQSPSSLETPLPLLNSP